MLKNIIFLKIQIKNYIYRHMNNLKNTRDRKKENNRYYV